MTYDEWVKYIAQQQLPSPPGSVNLRPKLGVPPLLQRQAPTPPPGFNSNVEADLARYGRDAPGNVMAASNAAINPIDFAGAATEDIDLNALIESIKNSLATEPPGFRDMPRSPNAPFLRERNTTVIPGPEDTATPYPRPPFLNLGHFLDTGERGPLPLNSRRPGRYPEPANEQMPEVYETRTSGGKLAQVDLPEPMAGGRKLFEMMNSLRTPVPTRGDTPDDLDKAYRLQQLMYELERARIMNDRPNLSQANILPQRPFNAA